MNKKCPICGEEMKKISSSSDMPSIPFIKIPEWIMEVNVYECQKCHFTGIWHEK
ncbi:MAG: hypothetical protein U9O96_02430 [Candidatus Thermoplasmatota archaeon]|nr:hypothetical protein [Candidatus Thermoplasmatota archaeon]